MVIKMNTGVIGSLKCPACFGTGVHISAEGRKVLKALEDATVE